MSQTELTGETRNGGVPRVLVGGAVALVVFTFLASGAARLTDIGTVHMPAADPVETLALRFVDQDDGGVGIVDATDNRRIFTVEPGTNGFIRATLRGFAQERKREGVGEEPPFRLIRWNDGTLTLEDAAIARRIGLDAFGPTNAQAFAQLFAARRHAP